MLAPLRPKTQLDYENNIYQHIIPALVNIPLNKLTSNDFQQFYAQMKKNGRLNRADIYGEGLSVRMVRACHSRCRTALDKAVQDGLIRVNPAADCKLPAQTVNEMHVLTREEMQRFLIQAKEEGYFELFLLELATGLRRGEVLALQWDDLDFDTGALHIQRQVYRANGKLVVSEPKTKTTLSIYTHVTDAMRQTAAAKIDRSIGKREPRGKSSSDGKGLPTQRPDTYPGAAFEPYKGKIRRPGTGCATQINDHLWEGRYSPKWPDGKKYPRNIYVRTEDECEEKLAELIQQTKAEIAEAKRLATEGKWEEAMALAGQKKARGTRTNQSRLEEKTITL